MMRYEYNVMYLTVTNKHIFQENLIEMNYCGMFHEPYIFCRSKKFYAFFIS